MKITCHCSYFSFSPKDFLSNLNVHSEENPTVVLKSRRAAVTSMLCCRLVTELMLDINFHLFRFIQMVKITHTNIIDDQQELFCFPTELLQHLLFLFVFPERTTADTKAASASEFPPEA